MSVSVSVVVPVYNPGKHLEPCIDSLLRQSMPADRLELIFVDDGSTDESPGRLDRLAAEHAHVHVVHQEASGWAGKPRNTGLQVATGDYVQFVDQDDWLGDEALERLHAYAVANDADVVLGKMVGVGGRTRAQAAVPDQRAPRDPGQDLADGQPDPAQDVPPGVPAGARPDVPRGPSPARGPRLRRLGLPARPRHLGAVGLPLLLPHRPRRRRQRRVPAAGAGRLLPQPARRPGRGGGADRAGALRDRLHRRWLRVEMVGRLRGAGLLRADAGLPRRAAAGDPQGDGRVLLARCRRGPGARPSGWSPSWPARATWTACWPSPGGRPRPPQATLERLEWDGDSLRVTVGATLVNADGTPVALRDGHLVAPLPEATLAGLCRPRPWTSPAARRWWTSPCATAAAATSGSSRRQPRPGGRHRRRGHRRRGGRRGHGRRRAPLARGIWDMWVKIRAYGWERATRVGLYRAQGVAAAVRPALVGSPPAVVTPYWTEPGNLALDVGQSTRRTAMALRPAPPTSAGRRCGRPARGAPWPSSSRSSSTPRSRRRCG